MLLHPMFGTLAGRACIARLVARAAREGLTVQEFAAANAQERGWGDPAVRTLLESWARGENLDLYTAEREWYNARMLNAVQAGDLKEVARDARFPEERRFEPVTEAGRALGREVRSASTRLRLAEDRLHALIAQRHLAIPYAPAGD